MTKTQKWNAKQIARMLADPFYTGIQVHPEFTRNIEPMDDSAAKLHRETFITGAKEQINAFGVTRFLRNLLENLKQEPRPGSLFAAIRVDQAYTLEREPIVTEADFTKAGVDCIQQLGSDKYLGYLLDNLEGK